MQTNKGVSLLELMLVLAIAAIIITLSLQQLHNYRRARDIATLEQSVAMLMQGLNTFYYDNHNCLNSNSLNNVTVEQLNNAGFLYGKIENPWGTLSVAIKSTNDSAAAEPPYYLQVSATIVGSSPTISESLLGQIQNETFADPGETKNNTITWTSLPSYSRNAMSSHQWVIQKGLATFVVAGRGMTSINEGMDSRLWIANGGLHTFNAYEAQQGVAPGQQQACPD